MNTDQTALLAHIETLNAEIQMWVDAKPGRGAGMIHTDIEMWNRDNVYTPEQFDRWSLATDIYYILKDKGFRANWGELFSKTREELKNLIESI